MSRNYYLSLILLCVPLCWAQVDVNVGHQILVPAGTLLHCTLDESNFSSQTAQVGDPVLCHLSSVEMFGRPVIPRGSLLSGRMQEYRDPGHFVGKGWLQLEFTGLTLPTGSFPLNAKVISATRYRVDKEGKIKGNGHPTRDAIEWSIPILWPIKVLTLPARGPRPTLKGETRLGLRLMEDVSLPNPNPRGLSSRSPTSTVIVVARYRLRHPVVGFIESAKEIVTIPAGAIVIARIQTTASPGLCTVDWDGRIIEVSQIDLKRHGSVVDTTSSWQQLRSREA